MSPLTLSARGLRRHRRVLALIAAVLVPLSAACLVRSLVDPVAFADRHLGVVESFAARVLERKLTIGSVEGHFYPELDLTVRDVVLSSNHDGEEPMLVLPSVQVRFRLRRALMTLGRELPLESVRVVGAVLRVHRDRDGRVDVLDVLHKLPPLNPRDLDGGVLSELIVDHAQVRLVDDRVADGADDGVSHEIVIDDVHLETVGVVALGEPLNAILTTAWGDDERPAVVELHVDHLPEDLSVWPPPAASVHLELPHTDLASGIAWLGLPALFDGGVVDVNVDALTRAHMITGTIDVRGTGISAVVKTGAGAGAETHGEESEASLRADVRVAVDGLRTEIDNFAFHGAGIAVEGKAALLQPSLEGIEAIDVMVRAEQLARLGLLIPPLRNTAPGALHLSGAGSGSLQAGPGDLALDLDLDGARVMIGEALSKQPGQRLRLTLKGTRDSLAAVVPGNVPGSVAGNVAGSVAGNGKRSSPGRIDATLHAELPRDVRIDGGLVFQPQGVDIALFDLKSNRTTLERAAALSPVLRDLVDGCVRRGALNVAMHARMSAADNAFQFVLLGRDVRMEVDKTTVTGDARLDITALTDVHGLKVRFDANLGDVAIETLDGHDGPLFDKPAGAALVVRASLAEVGGPGSLGRALSSLDASSQAAAAVFTGNGLSPRWRRFAIGMSGHGSVRAAHAVLLGVSLDDADAQLSLRQGKLTLEPAFVHAFSGRASLAGSVVDLRATPPLWTVALAVDDIELAWVLASIHTLTGDVSGRAAITATLRGSGLSLEGLLTSLDGPVTLRTHDVQMGTIDALSHSVDQLWSFIESVPGVSRADVEKTRGASLSDAVREGEWTASFHGNQLRVDQPVLIRTSLGVVTLSGHAALDGSIDLRARIALLPDLAGEPASGTGAHDVVAVADDGAVVAEASVTGTWGAPVVATSNLDLVLDSAKHSVEAGIRRAWHEANAALDAWFKGAR